MAVRHAIVQGDTWRMQVAWLNPLPGTTEPNPADPVDITGYGAKLQVRQQAGEPSALSLTSSPAAGLTVNGSAGTVDVRAAPAQTELITAGTWYWELELDNGTDRYTIAGGTLVVKAQVTV